jgi:hypothetical protein
MSALEEMTEDPCRAGSTYSGSRAAAFVMLFIAMFGFGGYAITSENLIAQLLAAVLGYTAAVMIYGFARNRGNNPPYLFTCPIVMSQYPRLLKRHAAFLAVLIAFLAIANRVIPHPEGWIGSARASDTPYFLLAVLIGVLAIIEVMTNRGVLEHAHNERFGEPPAPVDSKADGSLTIFGRDQ